MQEQHQAVNVQMKSEQTSMSLAKEENSTIDEAIEESFPASDPPAPFVKEKERQAPAEEEPTPQELPEPPPTEIPVERPEELSK